jgi:hypothetical protein
MKKILILALLAFLGFGCSRTEESKNTAPVNAPAANTQTDADEPEIPPVKEENYTAGADPRADLIAAAQKRQNIPFWSAKVTVEKYPEANAEMQYVAPDRYRFKLANGELIVVGSDSYSNEDGAWTKAEEGASEYIREQVTKGIAMGAMNLREVKIIGKEKVNGRDATVYTHTSTGNPTKIWIDTESGLELKNEVEEKNEVIGVLKRTTVYDYQTPVKIEAPKVD